MSNFLNPTALRRLNAVKELKNTLSLIVGGPIGKLDGMVEDLTHHKGLTADLLDDLNKLIWELR